MSKHLVIRDVSWSLLNVVKNEVAKAKARAKVLLGQPESGFLDKNAPAICLWLYEVKPYVTQRNEPWEEEIEEAGTDGEKVVIKYAHPLDLDLHYLVAAAHEDLGEQQALIALAMKAFMEHARLSGEELLGESWRKDEVMPLEYDESLTLERQSFLWQSLATPMRLAVGYRARARLYSQKELGRSKRVRTRVIDAFDPLRPPPGTLAARNMGIEGPPRPNGKK